MTLPLAGASFGYLYRHNLETALRAFADHGLEAFELTPLPPHAPVPRASAFEVAELRRVFARTGVRCISMNPTGLDLNLVSTNREFADESLRQMVELTRFTHDLGAETLVIVAGRRHALLPAAMEDIDRVLVERLGTLAEEAGRLGVTIAVENSPYGLYGLAAELVDLIERVDHPHCKVTYDCANALHQEDPAEGVRTVGNHLWMAHVSDTWYEHWAHTSFGRGEVDFAAFAGALDSVGYHGWTVYELIDDEDPLPRLGADLAAAAQWGWSPQGGTAT